MSPLHNMNSSAVKLGSRKSRARYFDMYHPSNRGCKWSVPCLVMAHQCNSYGGILMSLPPYCKKRRRRKKEKNKESNESQLSMCNICQNKHKRGTTLKSTGPKRSATNVHDVGKQGKIPELQVLLGQTCFGSTWGSNTEMLLVIIYRLIPLHCHFFFFFTLSHEVWLS